MNFSCICMTSQIIAIILQLRTKIYFQLQFFCKNMQKNIFWMQSNCTKSQTFWRFYVGSWSIRNYFVIEYKNIFSIAILLQKYAKNIGKSCFYYQILLFLVRYLDRAVGRGAAERERESRTMEVWITVEAESWKLEIEGEMILFFHCSFQKNSF